MTVTRTSSGSAATPSGGDSSNGRSLSGNAWNINPTAGVGGGVNGLPGINGYTSGLTFTFSAPVNAFGFEIGDWATCCTANTRSAAVHAALCLGGQRLGGCSRAGLAGTGGSGPGRCGRCQPPQERLILHRSPLRAVDKAAFGSLF